jgi:CheY-like chemotaxis protein
MGMTPEVLARVFEPFFTTKEAGRGTGLGLSQVYGFVKQTRGHIAIDSAVGHGTSVKIYLPQAVQPALGHKRGSPGRYFSIAADEAGTILLVEDDDAVRRFSAEVLWSLGYSVLEAPHARAALEILDAREDVRLLFTDIGLPGLMDGWELSDEVRQRRPELKVLVTTAYLRSPRTATRRNDPSVSLIAKPFSVAELSAKIQDIMGS